MLNIQRLCAVLAVAVPVVLAAPGDAMAQSKPAPTVERPAAPQGKVDVEIMVVHATETGTVDARLKNVQQNLSHMNFKGFKLLDSESARLSPGGETTLNIVGNRRLRVTVLSRDARQAKVRIRMIKEGNKVLDTTVNIPKGRYFMIAGPRYQGGKLIIPVGVDF